MERFERYAEKLTRGWGKYPDGVRKIAAALRRVDRAAYERGFDAAMKYGDFRPESAPQHVTTQPKNPGPRRAGAQAMTESLEMLRARLEEAKRWHYGCAICHGTGNPKVCMGAKRIADIERQIDTPELQAAVVEAWNAALELTNEWAKCGCTGNIRDAMSERGIPIIDQDAKPDKASPNIPTQPAEKE